MLCGIGVQITNIIIVVLYLFFDISRELLGACWVTSLIVVLFVSGGIGIIETGKECEGWLGKIGMYFPKRLLWLLITDSRLFFVSHVTVYI